MGTVYNTLCHILSHKVKLSVIQLCLILFDPMPTRLLHHWDFPGKNTGVCCHFLFSEIFPTRGPDPDLLHCRQILYLWATGEPVLPHRKKKVKVNSFPTLCDHMDYSLPGSFIHGIFQARVLEWIAISFSRGSSQLRDRTRDPHIAGRCFTIWATREALYYHIWCNNSLKYFYPHFSDEKLPHMM